MRKLILYIATSIDGLIAGNNGDLKWFDNFPNPKQTDYGYQGFYDTVDTVIMGGKTFRAIANMDVEWPYAGKTTYLISKTNKDPGIPGVSVLGENWETELKAILAQKGKNVWVVGGGELVGLLLKAGFIDTMILSQFPTILGKGTPLFTHVYDFSKWELSRGRYFSNGVIQTEYVRKISSKVQ